MPLPAAYKKAPEAIYLPLDMELYQDASAQVWNVVRAMGNPVEVWGWDEGYVGFGDPTDPPADAEAIALADSLHDTVRTETGLESCVGISDNKQRARIAAGFAKKEARAGADDDHRRFLLTDANWYSLMGDRPADALWSVGSRTAKKLSEHGIDTVAQLAAAPLDDLIALFGPHKGNWLYVLARGGGDDTISLVEPPAKSHSKSRTYEHDLTDREQLRDAAHDLLREGLIQVSDEGRMPIRVGVTVRTSTFFTRTKLRKLAEPTTDFDVIAPTVDDLLEAFPLDRPIRLVAVRLELAPPAAPAG